MRLQRYITEGYQSKIFWSDWWPLIEKNCKPYLNDVKISGNMLYRSMTGPDFQLKNVRKNRKPSDTPLPIHNYWDDMFKKNFGWKARSEGLFAWYSNTTTLNRRIVFPFGNYKVLWSPHIVDLFKDFNADEFIYFWEYRDNEPSEECENHIQNLTKSFKDIAFDGRGEINVTEKRVNSFLPLGCRTSSNIINTWMRMFEEAIKTYRETSVKELSSVKLSKCEVMVKCDKYYSMKMPTKDDFKNLNKRIRYET